MAETLQSIYDDPNDVSRLAVSNNESADKTPEQASRILRLEMQTGLPSQFIEGNVDEVERESATQGFDAEMFRQNNPKFASWLAQNPNHYAFAKNDISMFSKIGMAADSFGSGFQVAGKQEKLATILMKEMDGTLSPQEIAQRDALKQEIINPEGETKGQYVSRQSGYATGQFLSTGREALKGVAVGGGIGALAGLPEGGVGAIPGFMVGARIGAVANLARYSYNMETAFAFDQFRDLKDETGAPIDREVIKNVARGVGVINSIIETGSDVMLARLIPGAKEALGGFTKPAVNAAVKKALAIPTARQALFNASKKMLAAGSIEGTEEFFQALVGAGGREIAQAASGQKFAPDNFTQDLSSGAQQARDAFVGTFFGPGIFFGGADYIGSLHQVRQAQQTENFYKVLGEGVTNSETFKSLPEKAQEAVAAMVKDSPYETTYIDPQKWNEYWQSQGVDPREIANEVLGDTDAYDNANSTGHDIAIPTERYARKIAPTQHNTFFSQEIRRAPDAMNAREAKEFFQSIEEQNKPGVVKISPELDSSVDVYNDVATQLKSTGKFNDKQIESYASTWKSVFQTLGKRAGIDPMELYNRYKPQIKRLDVIPFGAVPEKTSIEQSAKIVSDAVSKADELGIVSGIVGGETFGFLTPDGNFISAEGYATHDKLSEALGIQKATDAVNAGLVRVSSTTKDMNYEVARGNTAGVEQINHSIYQNVASDLFKDNTPVMIDIINENGGLDKTVEFKAGEFLDKGGDIRDFLPQEYFQGERKVDTPAFKKWFGKSKVIDENGNPLVVYHGTTHTFDTFDLKNANIENHYGKAFYFTDSKTDVNSNYIGEGPDLTQRIERRAESIFSEMFTDKKEPKYNSAAYKKAKDKARELARKELSGGSMNVLPVYLKMENPLILDGDNQTRFELNYDEETGDESGSGIDLYNAVLRAATQFDVDGQEVWNDVFSKIPEPTDFTAREFDAAMRESEKVAYIEDRNDGSLAGNDFIKEVYSWAGFDGIIMDADKEFGSGRKMGQAMAMDEGTKHYIVFDPANIKSIDNQGTFDTNNPNIYMQNKNQARGRITFGKDRQFNIELFMKSDLSTFLHESGHFYLEVLGDLATAEGATEQIKEDYKTLLDWFGVENRDQIKREHHEQFARGFEAYLMEGKSPSSKLRSAFMRFKVWLTRIYQEVKNLNVTINDKIRGVFDRILATDDEIQAAQDAQNYQPLFVDPMKMGMTDAQAARYIEATEEARVYAEEQLTKRLMDEILREEKGWWKDELEQIHSDVTKEVNQRPVYIAISVLQRGEMPDGTRTENTPRIKLSRKDVIRFLNEKHKLSLDAQDSRALELEFEIDSINESIQGIEKFRKDVGKVRRYRDAYLKQELDRIPKRYITSSKFAKTIDEAATDMGFDNSSDLTDKMIENEIAYDKAQARLSSARKEIKSVQKANREVAYAAVREQVKRLPHGIMDDDGIALNVAADVFGYANGEEFVNALMNAKDKKEVIENESLRRMREIHGEFLTNREALESAAMKAVHSDKRAELLRMELQHLASNSMPVLKDVIRRVVRRMPTKEEVRIWAEENIAKQTVRDIQPILYQRAETKFAKMAGEALAKGDLNAAFDSKLKELYNHELYRIAIEARDDVDESVYNFRKFFKTDDKIAKSRDMNLVNAGRAILSQFGIGKTDKTSFSYLEAIKNYDPEFYAEVSEMVASATQTAANYKEITYDDFVKMKNSVEALWDLSKRSRQILIDGKLMDRDEAIKQLEERLDLIKKPSERVGYNRDVTNWDKTKMGLLGIRSALRRVESWVTSVDGGGKGSFRTFIWNPISEAVTDYREAKKGVLLKYLELAKGIEKTITVEPIIAHELTDDDGVPYTFSGKASLLHAILHTGNDSNLSKLLRGRGWGEYDELGNLTTSKWDAFIQRMWQEGKLSKADYDFVQGVWDLLEEIKPDAQKAHKTMYGYYFSEITAVPFETPFGKYRGGYVPAIADPFIVPDAAIRQERESLEKSDNSFMFPTTGRGFSKSRVEKYARPLALDLRYIPSHIDKVLRFTHIEPRVKDVGRIVMNKAFRDSLGELDATVGGDMLVPWLQRSALQKIEAQSKGWGGRALDTIFREIRKRSGLNIMVGNVVNTLQQFTGFSIGMVKVKPEFFRNALWDYIRNPKKINADITDKSVFMRNRSNAKVIETMNTLEDILLNPSKYDKALDFAQKHGYFLQQATQNIVDNVVWSGAYNQAVSEGQTEIEAVRSADSAVRETQGSFAPEDVSRFETGTPFMRAFTMFYSYFNMQANLLGSEFENISRDIGLKKGAGRALYIYTMGFMIPAVLSEELVKAFSGKPPDQDDDGYLNDIMDLFFGAQFRTAVSMVPGGTTIQAGVNAFNNKWYDDDIRSSPAVSQIQSAVHAPASVYRAVFEDGNKKTAVRDALTLIGLVSGIPVAPLARPLGYLSDVSEGEKESQNPIDFVRGAVTGR